MLILANGLSAPQHSVYLGLMVLLTGWVLLAICVRLDTLRADREGCRLSPPLEMVMDEYDGRTVFWT